MTREQRDLLREQIDVRTRERLAAGLPKFGGSHASDVPKARAGEVMIGPAASELGPPRDKSPQ